MASDRRKNRGPPPIDPHKPRRRANRVLSPVVAVFAAIYFLIDALFLPPIHWVAERLGRFRLFARLGDWIRSRGPYQTLALFLVPLILLEPVKPVAAYLMASKRFTHGVIVLVVGEILKITIVERLFHIGRAKLMTIPAFAWACNFVMRWLDYLKSLPAWQAVVRRVNAIKATARAVWRRMRARFRLMLRGAR